ncbi:putative multi-domain protein [hydrothermal vent metagenome]|uniref:Putative multi-domain protein n=1 Tax=hydrothermal vent metagenome TaxID=652676 RepID=A0A3B1E2N8_9ZZZZ
MNLTPRPSVAAVVVASISSVAMAQGVGYTDTPMLPGQAWKVHDKDRPNPPVVDPGPAGAPAPVPSDAVVLFDGTSTAAWQHGDGRDAEWIVKEDGSMQVKPGSGDLLTREHFGDCQLHIEWATPEVAIGKGQGRGNSGVFFFGMYEVQILDSYKNQTYADGQAAALYGQYPPAVNASRGPGEWQTFDIIFEAPRFARDGTLEKPAFVTVLHNGVVVQHRREFVGRTAHRAVASYSPHASAGPIKLQDHGNPMRFRNIWVRPLQAAPEQATAPAG